MLVYFNIGLDDLPRIINAMPRDCMVNKLHRYSGMYMDSFERGYSISARIEQYTPELVSEIAEKLDQECIAVYYPCYFQGEIIYSKLFTGDKITFDPDFFHMP